MKNRLDHLAITDAFIDLNNAWFQEDKAGLISACLDLNQAMLNTSENVYRQVHASAVKSPDNGGDLLLHWARTLSWSSQQYHQTLTDWLSAYVDDAPDLDVESRRRARFWTRQIKEMLAPSNCFWTNPKAVHRFVQSKGQSLVKGLRNLHNDLQRGDGMVGIADIHSFTLGENLAVTPGQVVHRNDLVEIIQYAPQTPSVWQTPIVLIQPWINKYYIFDLRPQNSLVQYLVNQGFTVFITSWKNPTADMRHITFKDYMHRGAMQAINVARQITQSEQVHAAGYCIGGTLLAALMGWLAHEKGDSPVTDITLFASLLDFDPCGDLAVFINDESIHALEKLLAAEGVLEDKHIASAFRLLNPGDLIWRYVANNYFLGESPPRSDMLFWNSDSTRLPEAMCLFYLKSFYLENRLPHPGKLVLDQRPIDLRRVTQPAYVVGAAKDHICPWPATFKTCAMLGGRTQYVLADQGHITGIVNPPSRWSKKKFRAGAATRRRDEHKWLKTRPYQQGSWWPHWMAWLKPRSGKQVDPPPMGSRLYPALSPAPGAYVME